MVRSGYLRLVGDSRDVLYNIPADRDWFYTRKGRKPVGSGWFHTGGSFRLRTMPIRRMPLAVTPRVGNVRHAGAFVEPIATG